MSTPYDVPQNLQNVLGTFWSINHPDPKGPAAVVEGVAQLGRQQALFLEEAARALAREQVQLYRQTNWYWLELAESSQTVGDDGWFEWSLPQSIVYAAAVLDKMIDPGWMLAANSDFQITFGKIRFRNDPLLELQAITDEGGDRRVSCWLFAVQQNLNDVYNQFGYAVGMQSLTSRQYKQLLNAVYDAIVGAPTLREITLVLSAATGIPVGQSDGEVVELVASNMDNLYVITDKQVYKHNPAATATVAEGDILNAGDTMTSALVVQLLGPNDLDDSVQALGIDEGLLSSCFNSGLIFDNKSLPLEIDTAHYTGFTRITWPLGGRRDDVERFFDLMHDRGIAEALAADATCLPDSQTYQAVTSTGVVRRKKSTLAHLLDNRTTSYGEPTQAHLPAAINPAQFMVQNVFRDRAIFASVDLAGTRRDASHLVAVAMQKILPPEQTLILQVALTPVDESITVGDVEDTPGLAIALTPLVDDADDGDIGERAAYWQQ